MTFRLWRCFICATKAIWLKSWSKGQKLQLITKTAKLMLFCIAPCLTGWYFEGTWFYGNCQQLQAFPCPAIIAAPLWFCIFRWSVHPNRMWKCHNQNKSGIVSSLHFLTSAVFCCQNCWSLKEDISNWNKGKMTTWLTITMQCLYKSYWFLPMHQWYLYIY